MHRPPYLLVSDVDGTLLGDPPALQRFRQWFQDQKSRLRLVYASGRFIASIRESIRQSDLPEPDAIIGGVGTEIALCGHDRPVQEWDRKLQASFNASAVRRCLSTIEGLTIQPDRFQSELKVSYFYKNAAPAKIDSIRKRLAASGMSSSVIYSSNRDVDIIPQGVHKGSASRFLAKMWNYEPNNVLVSGDSGNDISMFEQGFRGIIVGNALEELKARSNSRTYHSDRFHASGVLDGIQYWWEKDSIP